ncbi:disease resistance-like protein DSC1 [Cajanus cajan]|uniref:disease resistance-like protein DSC1 n=1 Tax=Cajanus cajan TaxID=3821 RepID=UPI00098D7E5F|nr:disease resistance-like protein DSC1 [Cajanus cajan]XP_020236194.1 disease resistance-like protein DSC1 [Cajanus cajan]
MAKQNMSAWTWSPKKYDVFISFRGEDVRSNFISHLRSALDRANIKAYADDANLHKGDEVWPSLSQAIHDSHLAIVVFSETYADSKWCLKELVEILHCRIIQGLVAIPVFYEVDPSHIRNYSGPYGEAIAKHETYFGDTDNQILQDWKAALTEAANISGWDSRSRDYKNESQVIEKIVKDVSHKLSLRFPVELKVQDLVEIEKHCEEVKLLLSEDQKHQLQQNVQVIGIWGMGGIGKTTIAKALFSQLFPQYDAVCFLANVREEAKRLGLTSLCDKLLSELLKDEHHKDNPAGSTFILRRLSNKRVLIVLDDMDSLDQVDILFREQCNFVGPDSKVIITTRNRHLLTGRVDKIYEVGIWNFVESLELFCLHAFKERHPNKGYEDLSERAVKYAGGVPLALKVLGSNLHCRSTEFWECELSKLMNCPNDRIQNVLQVSYDELDNLEKKIFLDIAFFFKGEDKDYVVRILDACGFYATSGVKVLEDKALITISYSGTIQMHDLIQEMGLNIVRGGIEDPGKRSRLRDIEEISDVLENKKGSNVIEGIKLDLSEIEDLHLKTNTLNLMTNLRILRLYVPSGKRSGNVHYSGVLNNLSGKLRYLEWNGCFLKSFPVTFCAKMLVEVCMPHSHVTELWQGVQDVANLVRIDLSECKHLKNLPDLSKASRLKWVNLFGCESLCDIHPSVFSFDTLETLILDGCKKLKSLKSEKHLTSLENISVNLCTSLMEFSVSSDSITSLDLSSTGIEMLDSPSFRRLRNLKALSVYRLRRAPVDLFFLKDLAELRIFNCRLAISKHLLHSLFCRSKSLQLLHLKNCCNLFELPDNIGGLYALRELRLDGSNVKTLPARIKHLDNLSILALENCRKLGSLTELPPFVTVLNAMNCRSLRTVSILTTPYAILRVKTRFISFMNCVALDEPSFHCIMEVAHSETELAAREINYKFVKVCFPGSRVPGHFKYRTTDSSITIDLPSSRSDFVGLCLCVVLSHSWGMKNLGAKIWCQCYVANGRRLGPATTWYDEVVTGLNSDHVFIWYDANHFDSIVEIYDTGERRVSFEFFVTNAIGQHLTIGTRECGVFLILDQKNHFSVPLKLRNKLSVALYVQRAAYDFITRDENDCIDINNQERDLTEDCSCSCVCLFDVLRYLRRLISI